MHDVGDDTERTRPARARGPVSAPDRRAAGPGLESLQQTAGNAAVARLVGGRRPVQRAAAAPAPGPAAAAGGPAGPAAPAAAAPVTDPASRVVWTTPATVSPTGTPVHCQDRAEVASVLRFVAAQLRTTGAALDEPGEQALTGMADQVAGEAGSWTTGGALAAADPGFLTGYVQLAEGLAQQQVRAAVERSLAALSLPAVDQAALDAIVDELTEQSHQAFIASDQDALAGVLDAIGKVEKLNSAVGDYGKKVKWVTDRLTEIELAARLGELTKKVLDVSKHVGEAVGTAKQVVEVVRDVATLQGIAGTSNGTAMMAGINQFAAGIDLVDKVIGKFGKAVPLFGDLWSKIYKPLVDACISGLRVIARHEERTGREFEILDLMMQETSGEIRRDANGAPVLGPAALSGRYFPGGQAVFSYVYAIRHGRMPALTDEVRNFFLDRKDLFNIREDADEQLAEGEWSLFAPSTWTRSGRGSNVPTWVAGHIDKVWGMLYGDLAQYIPN